MPPLTISLSCTTPITRAPSTTTRGVAPCLAMLSTVARTVGREQVVHLLHVLLDGLGSAFADLSPVQVDPAHARLRGEGHKRRAHGVDVTLAHAILFFGQHDNAAALWGLIGQGGQLRGICQLLDLDARQPG